jgi:hypothetical protein
MGSFNVNKYNKSESADEKREFIGNYLYNGLVQAFDVVCVFVCIIIYYLLLFK